MTSVFHEASNVESYYEEFIGFIDYYKNFKRPSVFIKYYNIDDKRSSFDDELKTTFDLYSSDIRFNIYSLTPTVYMMPVTNSASSVPDLDGMMFDGLSSIVVYTIETPKVHDLIEFYPPIHSNEIFRVASIRTQVNAIHSEPSIKWFELQLEYAPLKTTSKLKIEKHFVYDLPTEGYIIHDQYVKRTNLLNKIQNLIAKVNVNYNNKYDLYMTQDKRISIEMNEVVYYFKTVFSENYLRMFENLKTPYGYQDIVKTFHHNNLSQGLPMFHGTSGKIPLLNFLRICNSFLLV